MHGKEADNLQQLTGKVADSICQELIKQQGNKSQAPKPSLEGRLRAVTATAQPPSHALPMNGLPRPPTAATVSQVAPQVFHTLDQIKSIFLGVLLLASQASCTEFVERLFDMLVSMQARFDMSAATR